MANKVPKFSDRVLRDYELTGWNKDKSFATQFTGRYLSKLSKERINLYGIWGGRENIYLTKQGISNLKREIRGKDTRYEYALWWNKKRESLDLIRKPKGNIPLGRQKKNKNQPKKRKSKPNWNPYDGKWYLDGEYYGDTLDAGKKTLKSEYRNAVNQIGKFFGKRRI